MSELPPGVIEENGQLCRYVTRTAIDGEEWQQRRPVSLDGKEARAKRLDYYHPKLGWVLEGLKLEKDRSPEDILADGSVPVATVASTTEEEGD